MEVDLGTLLDLVNRGGVLVILLLILVGGHRRWWVFGWTYFEKSKSEEQWRERAWQSASTTDKALDVAAKKGP